MHLAVFSWLGIVFAGVQISWFYAKLNNWIH